MNAAHLHLATNHIPVVGVGLGFLLLVAGMIGKNEGWVKAAWFLFVLAALGAMPAFFSGDGAEEILKKLPEFSKSIVAPHEAMADYAFGGVCVLGAASLLGLLACRRRAVASWMLNLSLVIAMLCVVLLS